MTSLLEANNVTYEPFSINLLEPTALVVGQAFSGSDPIAVVQELSVQDFYEYILLLGEWLAELGLSIIAKDKESEQVIGALIAADFASEPPLEMGKISDKFAPIFHMFESLDNTYKQDKQIQFGKYLHLYMLAVSPQHRGKGIAQNLVSTTLEYGKKEGYKFAVTEAANQTSQHIFGKAGLIPRCKAMYSNFTYNDKRVFEVISDKGGTFLMDKHLNS
ncbi:GNAT family N-acetyltransferase [Mastigocoleus testarum]|uniref:N-acetyltransferase domain-containing protein n=1 Tax=Mastigocoleus testarum BC008 TaxID=371196 RepID=A0A0V7ZLT3_9CYAN|nr:GNAT family N-acetyltransferase [Mastigocoleus testarum]KST65552.1 hypothetical protein BC008_42280 [Mastigocoleus testarum BC008]KST66060.1 hypothetical protein BC008_24080 [Mastigocoleus testarum BC008]